MKHLTFFYLALLFGMLALACGNDNEGDPSSDSDADADVDGDADADADGEGRFTWAKSFGGPYNDEVYEVVSTSDGSSMVTGISYESAVFGSGETNETTLTSTGYSAWFVFEAKYNPNGTLAWAKKIVQFPHGSTNFVDVVIDVLSDDTTVMVGDLPYAITLGEGEPNEITLEPSLESGNTFLAKYDSLGALEWAVPLGAVGEESYSGIVASSIASFSDDTFIVTGTYYGAPVLGSGQANETVLPGNEKYGWSAYIAKYNDEGLLEWATSLSDSETSTNYRDIGSSTLPDGSFVLAGGISAEMGIAKFSSKGTLEWSVPQLEEGILRAMASSPDGATVVLGSFNDSITFDLGGPNETTLEFEKFWKDSFFVAKYDPEGSFAWATQVGGSTGWTYCFDVSAAPDGSSFVTGGFWDTVFFDTGAGGGTMLKATAQRDVFIAKLNPDGFFVWADSAIGNSYYEDGMGVSAVEDGSVLVTGEYRADIVFGEGTANETHLPPEPNSHLFIAKYGP